MPTNSFVFYRSFIEALKKFSPEDFKTTIIALADYALDDKETKLSGTPETAMIFMKPLMDSNKEKRSSGRKGGKQSGEARRSKIKQNEANTSNSEKSRSNGNGNEDEDEDGNGNEEIPCSSNEPPDIKTSSKCKPKELTLRDREPINDYEKVEKAYLQNWDTLYSQNKVKTPNPVTNLGKTRSVLDTHFKSHSPEIIIQAINRGMNDKWVLENGYSLYIMLNANILNRLINGSTPPPGMNGKKTLSGLNTTF